MKTKILLLFILFSSVFFGQIASTNSLIKKLDNSQFKIIHEQKATFTMNSPAALKLIKRGTSISGKLVMALSDTTKSIMAHLVLCHIYFGMATFAGPVIITENDKHISKYFLGKKDGEGLMISQEKDNNVYRTFVLKADRDVMINYWKNKIAIKK